MVDGLNPGRLVNVSINLAPQAAARRSFGVLAIAGDSAVIDVVERLRSYTDIESVAQDFGTSAPEYQAALLYFGQSPKPNQLMIGRWARTDTPAILNGGILTSADQALSNFTSITAGGFEITISGTTTDIGPLDFSSVTNLNGVASVISTAMTNATCTWDGSNFTITTDAVGDGVTISYAGSDHSFSDVSALLKLNSSSASAPVQGIDAETAVECVTALMNNARGAEWYGLSFASSVQPVDDQLVSIASLIEAASIKRVFGVTATSSTTLDSAVTNDIASRMKAGAYRQTVVQYSANKYAVCSLLGRAFSVNFSANKSTITLMYKVEPSVVAETLTETQAQVLESKRCNVYVNYQNNTAIIQNGVMSGPAYFDEIHGLDWLADAMQNALYNLLYQTATKIPQTEDGQAQLNAEVSRVCDEAVNNGLVAPGVWNADSFGNLNRGDFLKRGYYVYSAPLSSQAQAEREQRKAVPIQVAIKLAGAVHTVDVIVNVNR